MNKRTQLTAGVLLVACAGAAAGATRYVGGGGTPSYARIQDAINAAGPGDEIRVAPGTYKENIHFGGKAIRLYAGSGDRRHTTIRGTGKGPVVTCARGEGPATVLEGFTITGGSSRQFGGGMYNENSSPTVRNCTFTGNVAFYGGGMYNFSYSSPMVVNCTFSGNQGLWHGGGMYNSRACSPTVTNCTFRGNTSKYYGGGMFNDSHCHPVITNCTFSGNAARCGGGGMSNWYTCSPRVTNCILWANAGGEIHNGSGATADVAHSAIQGGFAGAGNIAADPLFMNADGGDLHLQSGSPCIDKGDNTAVPAGATTDPDGQQRIAHGTVDMGAFEAPGVTAVPTAVDDRAGASLGAGASK